MSRSAGAFTVAVQSLLCPSCGALPGTRCRTMRSYQNGLDAFAVATALGRDVDTAPVNEPGTGRPTNPHGARIAWAHSEGLTRGIVPYPNDHRPARNARPVFDPDRSK